MARFCRSAARKACSSGSGSSASAAHEPPPLSRETWRSRALICLACAASCCASAAADAALGTSLSLPAAATVRVRRPSSAIGGMSRASWPRSRGTRHLFHFIMAATEPQQSTRARLLQHVGVSLVGALVTAACSFLWRSSSSGRGEEEAPAPSAPAPVPVASSTGDPSVWADVAQRLWKPAVGLLLILIVDIARELDLHGWRDFRVWHVLTFQAFRDQLRGLVQGQGLPPIPEAPSQMTAQERHDAEVAAACERANARDAQRSRASHG